MKKGSFGVRLVIIFLVFALTGFMLWGYFTGNIRLSRASSVRLGPGDVTLSEDATCSNDNVLCFSLKVQASGGLKNIAAMEFILMYNGNGSNEILTIDNGFNPVVSSRSAGESKEDYFDILKYKDMGRRSSGEPIRERFIFISSKNVVDLSNMVDVKIRLRKKSTKSVTKPTFVAVDMHSFRVAGFDEGGAQALADIAPSEDTPAFIGVVLPSEQNNADLFAQLETMQANYAKYDPFSEEPTVIGQDVGNATLASLTASGSGKVQLLNNGVTAPAGDSDIFILPSHSGAIEAGKKHQFHADIDVGRVRGVKEITVSVTYNKGALSNPIIDQGNTGMKFTAFAADEKNAKAKIVLNGFTFKPFSGKGRLFSLAFDTADPLPSDFKSSEVITMKIDSIKDEVIDLVAKSRQASGFTDGSCAGTGDSCLNFKLKAIFVGITKQNEAFWKDKKIKAKVKAISKCNPEGKSTGAVETTFSFLEYLDGDGKVVWQSNDISLNRIAGADKYYLYVYPEKHAEMRICSINPSANAKGFYNCKQGEYIKPEQLKGAVDLTNMYLFFGDIPVNGAQDGYINAEDIGSISQNMGKKGNPACDGNYDGLCDGQDFALIQNYLREKQSPKDFTCD